jgi:hypothetical protein
MRERIKIISQKKNKETSSLSQFVYVGRKELIELLNKQQLKKENKILLKKGMHSRQTRKQSTKENNQVPA